MKYEYNVMLRVTACTVLIIGQVHLFIKTSSLSLNESSHESCEWGWNGERNRAAQPRAGTHTHVAVAIASNEAVFLVGRVNRFRPHRDSQPRVIAFVEIWRGTHADILNASQLAFKRIGLRGTFSWWLPLEKLFGFSPVSFFIRGSQHLPTPYFTMM